MLTLKGIVALSAALLIVHGAGAVEPVAPSLDNVGIAAPAEPTAFDAALPADPLVQESGWTGGLIAQPADSPALPEPAPLLARDKGFRLRLGAVDLRPLLQTNVVHDDNIYITPSAKVHDVIYTITPGVLLGMGDYFERKENFVSLAFSPSFIIYQDNNNLNTVDYSALFDAQYVFNRLTLAGSLAWEKLSAADRDVGGRVDRDIYTAGLKATYVLGERTALEVGVQGIKSDYKTQISSNEFINRNWFVYKLTDKLDLSSGVTFGYLSPSDSPHQTYQQALLRARLASTEKLNFTAAAGVEFRQFHSDENSKATPVFDLGGSWRPYDYTTVSLALYRRVTSSASLQGQNYTSTGISGSLQQRLYGPLSLELSGGYERSDYSASDSAGSTSSQNREDKYAYGRVALKLPIQSWSAVSVYYYYRNNDSTVYSSGFSNNQLGVDWKVTF